MPVQVVEDVIETLDGSPVKKSSEYTGFKKFLFGCLESLNIDVSSFMGELEVEPVRQEDSKTDRSSTAAGPATGPPGAGRGPKLCLVQRDSRHHDSRGQRPLHHNLPLTVHYVFHKSL